MALVNAGNQTKASGMHAMFSQTEDPYKVESTSRVFGRKLNPGR